MRQASVWLLVVLPMGLAAFALRQPQILAGVRRATTKSVHVRMCVCGWVGGDALCVVVAGCGFQSLGAAVGYHWMLSMCSRDSFLTASVRCSVGSMHGGMPSPHLTWHGPRFSACAQMDKAGGETRITVATLELGTLCCLHSLVLISVPLHMLVWLGLIAALAGAWVFFWWQQLRSVGLLAFASEDTRQMMLHTFVTVQCIAESCVSLP